MIVCSQQCHSALAAITGVPAACQRRGAGEWGEGEGGSRTLVVAHQRKCFYLAAAAVAVALATLVVCRWR